MTASWSNWSGSVHCTPREIARPESDEAVAALVKRAAAEGLGVRVAGAGHSSQPLCATDGLLLQLDGLAGIEAVDPETGCASLRAGSRLRDLGGPLREHGLAFQNLGDIDVQALAGALATGTHGTGCRLGNLSSRVEALRVVDARGEIQEWTAAKDPERLRAARVSLGALGVMLAATVRLVPAYRLHERVTRGPVEEVLETLDTRIAGSRHFEFFYFPKHDFAESKALDPTDADPDPLPDRKGERIGWSADVLPSVREDRFHEMEYALPAAAGPACFAALRERLRARHPDVVWPLEYRTVAGDDAMLSPAHGRASVTLSVHRDGAKPFREVFADLEPLLLEHGGRPHWGKIHGLGAEQLAGRYPDWEAFQALRRRVDPEGRFANEHLRALFGS